MTASNRADTRKWILGLRTTVLLIVVAIHCSCSRVTEITHSITNSISNTVSNTLPNKSSTSAISTTTRYSDGEGGFNASLLESIKPNKSTEDWMLKHFGDAATFSKIDNDMTLLNWPFIVETKKRKKLFLYFGSTNITQKPMFLHTLVGQSVVRAVWVNEIAQPKSDEGLRALEHPQPLVMSDMSAGGKNKAAAVPLKPANRVVIPDTSVAEAPQKSDETATAPASQIPSEQLPSGPVPPEPVPPGPVPPGPLPPGQAPPTSTPPIQPDKSTSDVIKLETKEPVPAKSESTDEKTDDDQAKEVGQLKSK